MQRANTALLTLLSWGLGLFAVFAVAILGGLLSIAVGLSYWVGFVIAGLIGLFVLIYFQVTADRATKALTTAEPTPHRPRKSRP